MATYDFLGPGEALHRAGENAREFERITGLRGIEADRLQFPPTRTKAGNSRVPEDPWRAYGDRDKFREIVSVIRTRDTEEDRQAEEHQKADFATVTVTFADGETTYIHAGDLLCVERPV